VRIRQVEPGEWEALRDLRLSALADSPDAFGTTFAEERVVDEARWRGWATGDGWPGAMATFIADFAGAFVGMATGHQPDDDLAVAWLFAMWVRPDVRGRGIGRDLVDAVVAWANGRPAVERLVLRVTESNAGAANLYASCGFVDAGMPGTAPRGLAALDSSDAPVDRARLTEPRRRADDGSSSEGGCPCADGPDRLRCC
jgi:GNAT superfamily N-acetyltransferase